MPNLFQILLDLSFFLQWNNRLGLCFAIEISKLKRVYKFKTINLITNFKNNPSQLSNSFKLNGLSQLKLFSYQNRLHQAIAKNQQSSHAMDNSLASPLRTCESSSSEPSIQKNADYTNCSSVASSQYSSQTGLNIQSLNSNPNSINLSNSDETLSNKINETNLSKKKVFSFYS